MNNLILCQYVDSIVVVCKLPLVEVNLGQSLIEIKYYGFFLYCAYLKNYYSYFLKFYGISPSLVQC